MAVSLDRSLSKILPTIIPVLALAVWLIAAPAIKLFRAVQARVDRLKGRRSGCRRLGARSLVRRTGRRRVRIRRRREDLVRAMPPGRAALGGKTEVLSVIEIPEAMTLARQVTSVADGRQISRVTAARSPHKFAWYSGDPGTYHGLLAGKTVRRAEAHGGMVAVPAGDVLLIFGEGVSLRYGAPGDRHPAKHQLLIELEDGSFISASVRMYGWLLCSEESGHDNTHYEASTRKPSPLSDRFDWDYFRGLAEPAEVQRLSAKAFLATEQRIPGLGNGVLQDILYGARIHPKRKMATLSASELEHLFGAARSTLAEMAELGGRDTEKDLFGQAGGYRTRLSRNTAGGACPECGSTIQKASYLGGSVYFCGGCQTL